MNNASPTLYPDLRRNPFTLPLSVSRQRTVSACVALGIALLAAVNVHADEAVLNATETDALASYDGQLVDTVVVLGTSRNDTTVLTSTAPIEVITAQQLQETGAVTLNAALSLLDPSFNFPQGQNAVKGMGIRSASLRGVGPGYTLVLVDGKRRNASAMLAGTDPWTPAQVVDLNVIPISAIERVEVLRDGAAAQYGSDAVAGVVNIILKKDASGGEINVHGGGYTDGGGATKSLTASKGFEIGADGFANASIDLLDNSQVSRTRADWRQLYPNGDPRNASADGDWGGKWGQASRRDWKLLTNSEIGLGGDARAYGYINYANQSSSNYVNFDRVVLPIASGPIKGSPDAVTDPYNYNSALNPWLHPNGNQPLVTYGFEDLAALAGVRFGNPRTDGKLDLSLAYGNNVTKRWVGDTSNPSWGAASADSFYLGSWKDDTASVTADYVREIPATFLIDPAVLSAGVLHRNEHWGTGENGEAESYTPGALAGIALATLYKTYPALYPYANPAANAQATANSHKTLSTTADLVGIRPQDDYAVSRSVNGAYLGGDFHVTSALQLGLTARYEDYSDFGGTSNYKLTGRYEVTPAFALRGTLSSGFHAPSLAMLGTQTTSAPSNWSNNGSGGSSGYILAFRSSDPREQAFGAKPLEPEKSKTLSLGSVIRLDETSSLTVDAYRMVINGVITGSQNLSGAAVTQALTATGLASTYSTVSYDLNAWNSTTSGLDVVAHKLFALSGGNLDLTAAASLLKTSISDVNKYANLGGTQFLAISDYQVRDAERGTPGNKIVLDARYKTGAWIWDGNFTHYGTYWYDAGNVPGLAAPNGNIDQEFAPEGYLNGGVTYKVGNNWHVDFSVQNLLNKYPEQYVKGNSASGINPYSFIAPNGAAGRYLYAGASFTF